MLEHSWGIAQMCSFPMGRLPVAAYFRVCGRDKIYLYKSVSKNRLRLILLTRIAMESYELAQVALRSKLLTFVRAELDNLVSPWRMTQELSTHTYARASAHLLCQMEKRKKAVTEQGGPRDGSSGPPPILCSNIWRCTMTMDGAGW